MRGRQIGTNMKPRQSDENTGQSADEQEVEVSDSGEQALGVVEPISEALERAENDTDLESETEKTQSVAVNDGFQVPPKVPSEVFSELAKLMKESEEAIGAARALGIIIPSAAAIAAIENGDRLPTIADLEAAIGRGDNVNILPDGSVKIHGKLGEQPDGTFGMVVMVPEGMIEGIRQQADSDKVTPEEWVSVRLGEYLSQWWAPPRHS